MKSLHGYYHRHHQHNHATKTTVVSVISSSDFSNDIFVVVRFQLSIDYL